MKYTIRAGPKPERRVFADLKVGQSFRWHGVEGSNRYLKITADYAWNLDCNTLADSRNLETYTSVCDVLNAEITLVPEEPS